MCSGCKAFVLSCCLAGCAALSSERWAARFCEDPELQEATHCSPSGCDSISFGSRFCVAWMGAPGKRLQASVGTPSWENCIATGIYDRMDEFQQHPPPLLQCPHFLPIAFLAVPKSGSTSLLLWLARNDHRMGCIADSARFASACLRKHHKQMTQKCLADGFYQGNASCPSLKSLGCSRSQSGSLAERALRWHQSVNSGWLVLPPFLCPQCCRQGIGRLLVVMARNPYMRLASYYKRWIGPRLNNNWSRFGEWVNLLANVSRQTDAFRLCHGVPGVVAADDVLHTRSVREMLDDPRLPARSQRSFAILHLETLQTDIRHLERQLCREFHHCRRLPSIQNESHHNSRATELFTKQPGLWHSLWDGLSAAMREMYGWDFKMLGYAMDPTSILPRRHRAPLLA